jgi:hypothetical protein
MIMIIEYLTWSCVHCGVCLCIENWDEIHEQTKGRETEKQEEEKGNPDNIKAKRTTRQRVLLEEIIEEHPEFYLDKIQERLYKMGGGWWSRSYIWYKLHRELNYMLQVATDRAYKIDKEEQTEYLDSLIEVIIHGHQLVFLDGTAKGKNSSRRRLWSKRGLTPFRASFFQRKSWQMIYNVSCLWY